MAQAKCILIAVTVLLVSLMMGCETATAATYTVGDSVGWTFGVVNWPNGKTFAAGDVLVFNYLPGLHNLVLVDESGYFSCTAPAGAQVFQSGNDRITLKKGPNFFICTFPGHCSNAVKVAVNASRYVEIDNAFQLPT